LRGIELITLLKLFQPNVTTYFKSGIYLAGKKQELKARYFQPFVQAYTE